MHGFFLKSLFIYFERERAREKAYLFILREKERAVKGQRERERERERIPSRLCIVSAVPNEELELTNCETRTNAETKSWMLN